MRKLANSAAVIINAGHFRLCTDIRRLNCRDRVFLSSSEERQGLEWAEGEEWFDRRGSGFP